MRVRIPYKDPRGRNSTNPTRSLVWQLDLKSTTDQLTLDKTDLLILSSFFPRLSDKKMHSNLSYLSKLDLIQIKRELNEVSIHRTYNRIWALDVNAQNEQESNSLYCSQQRDWNGVRYTKFQFIEHAIGFEHLTLMPSTTKIARESRIEPTELSSARGLK